MMCCIYFLQIITRKVFNLIFIFFKDSHGQEISSHNEKQWNNLLSQAQCSADIKAYWLPYLDYDAAISGINLCTHHLNPLHWKGIAILLISLCSEATASKDLEQDRQALKLSCYIQIESTELSTFHCS